MTSVFPIKVFLKGHSCPLPAKGHSVHILSSGCASSFSMATGGGSQPGLSGETLRRGKAVVILSSRAGASEAEEDKREKKGWCLEQLVARDRQSLSESRA